MGRGGEAARSLIDKSEDEVTAGAARGAGEGGGEGGARPRLAVSARARVRGRSGSWARWVGDEPRLDLRAVGVLCAGGTLCLGACPDICGGSRLQGPGCVHLLGEGWVRFGGPRLRAVG